MTQYYNIMKMDFDIGDLFYIIMAVLFIVAGAFGKKKKPVQRIPSQADTESPETPLIAEDILETKLKEFFGGYQQPYVEPVPEPGVEEGYEEVEKIDLPVSTETVYATANVFSPETKLDDYKSPFDNTEEMLDSIGTEEGIPNWNYAEEVHITDEIKLSEGKELESVDRNPEMEELLANFDARQGIIYSEIFERKEFGYK